MLNDGIKSHLRNRNVIESRRIAKQRRQLNSRFCRTVADDLRGVVTRQGYQTNDLFGNRSMANRRRISSGGSRFKFIKGPTLDKLIAAETNALIASINQATYIQPRKLFPWLEYDSAGLATRIEVPRANRAVTDVIPENMRQGIMKAIHVANAKLNGIERNGSRQGGNILVPYSNSFFPSPSTRSPKLLGVDNNVRIVNRLLSHPTSYLNRLIGSIQANQPHSKALQTSSNDGYYQPRYFLLSKHGRNRNWRNQAMTHKHSTSGYLRPLPTLDYTPIEMVYTPAAIGYLPATISDTSTDVISVVSGRSQAQSLQLQEENEIPEYIAVRRNSSITYLPARINQTMQTVTPLPLPMNEIPGGLPEPYDDKHAVVILPPENFVVSVREDGKRVPMPISRSVVLMPPTVVRPDEYESRFGPTLLPTERILEFIRYLGLDEAMLSPPEASGIQIEVLGS